MCVRVQVRLSLRQRVRDISAFMCIHREAGIVHGTTPAAAATLPVRGRRCGARRGSGKEEGAGQGGVVGGAVAQLFGYEDVGAVLLSQ